MQRETFLIALLVGAVLTIFVTPSHADDALPQAARQFAGPAPCGKKCRFGLCRGRQIVTLPAPNRATFPLICRVNQNIGAVTKVGQALVVPEGEAPIPISKWRPDGLSDPFRRKYFVPRPVTDEDNYGLSRKPAVGNQNEFTDRKCFILPIKQYELIKPNGKLVIKSTTNPERDCLAFVAKTPRVLIEVLWFSGDDLDLAVVEPDGDIVSNRNKKTECGVLGADGGVDICDIRSEGSERIVYNYGCPAQRGKYKAILRHASNCGSGPTRWELRVIVDGRIVKASTGESNADGRQKIAKLTFTL